MHHCLIMAKCQVPARLQGRRNVAFCEAQEGSPLQVTRSLFFKAPGHQVTFFHEKIKTTQVTGRFFKLSRSRGRPQNDPRSQVAKPPSWASSVGLRCYYYYFISYTKDIRYNILQNIGWLSGGFTPCRHLRPSSGREHTIVTYSVR